MNQLRGLLAKYHPPLTILTDQPDRYELEFDKDYRVRSARTGRVDTKHGMYFAGLIIQKSYVGLYFMPVYSHSEEFSDISPRLKKARKGKSCFYLTELDDELRSEIAAMLETGYRIFEDFESFD